MGRTLNRISLTGGTYRGLASGAADAPGLQASCGDRLFPVAVSPLEDDWQVEVDLTAIALQEGVQTVLITEGDEVLDSLSIVAGLDAPDDIRAEVDRLRAELDMLKTSFRRHVRETTG